MVDPPAPMKWWGWGDPARHDALPATAVEALRSQLGVDVGAETSAVPLDDVRLPDPGLRKGTRRRLGEIVGQGAVRDDRLTRVTHAAGKSYPDLVRMRAGDAENAPDAVVYPADAEEVRAVLRVCAEDEVAVIPFGGGTSVVGGVEPLRNGFGAAVSLDLGRLTTSAVDKHSLTAALGAGLRGPAAEAGLAAQMLTLGHFPQSFEYATVGGWVATRSAGQASTGYGSIEKLVSGLRCVAPAGEFELQPMPATAAGPGMRQLLIGSEGLLGVITEATLKVRPVPDVRRYEGWMFRGFEEGAEAFRALEQRHVVPDVARLSDEHETRLSLTLSDDGSLTRRIGRRYMGARGYSGGCLAIVGFEGERSDVNARRARAAAILRRAGGLALGSSPGRAWERQRYAGPYLRDALLDRAVMAETLETATTWSRLMELYGAVAGAIRGVLSDRGTPGLVMCHISHLYPDGASLYYTFIAPQEAGKELKQWQAVKTAACDAIVDHGGTITHHHAIGRDHAPWMSREIGSTGVEVLRAAKDEVDPAGILNPGKVLA